MDVSPSAERLRIGGIFRLEYPNTHTNTYKTTHKDEVGGKIRRKRTVLIIIIISSLSRDPFAAKRESSDDLT